MSLRVVGEVNKLSKEMLSKVEPLKPRQKAVYRLLKYVEDPITKQKLFGGVQTINLKDTIRDSGTGDLVTIGVPEVINGNKVDKFKKHILNGGGEGGQVGEDFELYGGNLKDEELYFFLELCNENASNKDRDLSVEPKFRRVDLKYDAKRITSKTNQLREALNKQANMNKEAMLLFAAGMNWDINKEYDVLEADVADYAQKNPSEFLRLVGNEIMHIKAQIKLAINRGIIVFDPIGFKMSFAESGALITRLTKDGNKDELELMADWCNTSANGMNTFETIKKASAEKLKEEIKGEEIPQTVKKKDKIVEDVQPPVPTVIVDNGAVDTGTKDEFNL